MKRGIIILSVILFSIFSYGQNSLSGRITDKTDNTPLVGANVYFPELSKGVVSDKEGKFLIEKLPKGEQLLTVSFIGYKTEIRKIVITAGRQTLDVALSPLVVQGEEVVISGNFAGSQHVNTVKISTLKSRTLQNVATPSFIKAITAVPGVDMISKGPGIGTPVIRGLSTSNILFLNNGIPMENFQFSVDHPYMVNESGVGKVEVLKGPASLLYGSGAVGGIINIIPKAPLPEGEIKGEASFNYYSNTQGLKGNIGLRGTNKNIIWGITGNINSNKDYVDGNGKQVVNSRFNTSGIKADAGLINKHGSFRIFTEFSNNKLGLTVPPSIQKVNNNDRKNQIWYQDLSDFLIHSQNKIWTGKFKTYVDAAWQQNHRLLQTDPDNPFYTAVDMLLNSVHYSAKTTFPVKGGFKVSSGFQGMWQNNKNGDAPNHVLPDATINELSAFVLGQFQTEKLNIETGIRYTYYNVAVPEQPKSGAEFPLMGPLNRTYNNVSFSLGATWHLSRKLLLRANLASAFRSPNLAELTQNGIHGTRYEVGNPDLETQRNTEADLGLHLHTIHTTLDVSGFYNFVNNYIYLSPSADTTATGLPVYYYLQDTATLYGGEAKLHIHPHPVHWLHILAKWSYVIGKKTDGAYLPFIPAQKFRFEVKLQKNSWSVFKNSYVKVGTDIALAQNNPAQFETSTDGYALLDAGIGTGIKTGKQIITISITGSNLFNKAYKDHLSTLKPLGICNSGRNIALSVVIPIGVKN